MTKAAHYSHSAHQIPNLESQHFRLGSQHGDLDRYQNSITCSFYHLGLLHKALSQSVHNFLSNFANRKTERQAKQTLLKT